MPPAAKKVDLPAVVVEVVVAVPPEEVTKNFEFIRSIVDTAERVSKDE